MHDHPRAHPGRDGTRQLNGLVAGGAGMPWRRFLAVDIAGSGLWVGTWCIGLYAMERHAALLHAWLERLNPWVAGAFLAALAGLLVWLLRRRGRS